jgi:CRP/FNR family cyclic AMP-dependent transcriptional regulator
MLFFREASDNPRLALIRSIILFQNLTNKELKIVDVLLHERTFLKDEIIFDEGEIGQAIYIILSGKVTALRKGTYFRVNSIEFGPGEFFGELALLDKAPRSAQLRATADTKVLALFSDDFAGLLETHSKIASKISLQLARHLGRRLRNLISGTDQTASL